MTIYFAMLCGLIQGLTEFLPVSSSAHLILCERMFGGGFMPDVSFDALLHLGTLAAVCIVYRRELRGLVPAAWRVARKALTFKLRFGECDVDERLVLFCFVSTLPLTLAPLFDEKVEALRYYPKAVGVLLMVNGAALWFSDRLSSGNKREKETRFPDALLVGAFQLAAVFPGISRSGATVTGGRICGFDREYAVKYSFLLSIPAVVGANVFTLPDVLASSPDVSLILPYALGALAAALSGVAAMKLLIRISKSSRFSAFALYCVAAGLLTVLFIN